MLEKFKNEPLIDFTKQENIDKMEEAFKKLDVEKGKEYPLIIGGEKIYTDEKITSYNPCNFKEIIGIVSKGNEELADKSMCSALEAFEMWKNVCPKERANYLFKAAAIMRRKKFDFSALLVEEAGKTWIEADADVAEAIDFLEYYGRQMLKFAKGMDVGSFPGEINECYYIPMGVGIVIAPWNFPLAILTGMTAASIVTGNTVVIKPSSSTPVVAAKFMEIWDEIKLPDGVINYLPGPGESVGNYLVSHPKTRFINFTGSKDVGLNISKMASDIKDGQKCIKRVIAEMGGKDTIIVDNEADLDAAAEGIVASAFGFQGQKCSACSRAIIVEDIYDEMIDKIVEKTKKLKIGPTRKFDTNFGAVIDENAYEKILTYIEIGRNEGKICFGGNKCGESGYFIEPTIIVDVSPDARISQEEIFGPVLSVIKVDNFDCALNIANDTDYGLTGAVYSNNRQKLEKAKREFHVGNLYLNRKCTGALVGVQPFGGFKLSGTCSKAGGEDYLLLFMEIKSVAERL
ncbi:MULTISPECIES: L-glutamate gamma-semialdehyde dehydrogenase [Sporanaerobacter]|jgi:1-pyrroline-5-carboxylate dehydrogenase|uniref:L-glutamate gamma-semialdehyde dehydrogenase n=1 Tax=Sporanaerobacter acetigenes DSM 13106 TaxID=1123281 RepID=A0A1M5X7F3_9FIRM|nr:L-glutamate gamma-semialdehyde dehydrogenase [Sporanaerobacter acetigenes]SHH95424.1 delta-1-pyrroline-5-carboxylate dehydrogenase [Sporanaerobacter acetigenes DSM 13106]